jgi:hypothetical protein
VDTLEQDAREVLRLVRSVKNTFAPINQIPQEIFSLIPGYRDTEKALVALTHVCRSWREQLISCSSLWSSLNCVSVDRTRVYLESSQTSPLDIRLGGKECAPFLHDAFLLTLPHRGRLKNLYITALPNDLAKLTKHFSHCRAPVLEKLRIHSFPNDSHTIQAAIFNGDHPATCARICGGDERNAMNGETTRVVSGRGGRIWKPLLPQFDVGFPGVEFDVSEEVLSRQTNPGFGDEATRFERRRFVV